MTELPLSGIAPYIRGEAATFIPNSSFVQEIVLISTEKSDRSLFYTTSGIIESKMTLRDIESLLSPLGFFRTHKGYIVNLSMIQEIQNQDNGTLLLTLSHYPREKVPVSRHYIKDFKNTLHLA